MEIQCEEQKVQPYEMNISNSKLVKPSGQIDIKNQLYSIDKENINLDNVKRNDENNLQKLMKPENREKLKNLNDDDEDEDEITTSKHKYRNGSCFCVFRD